MVELSDFLGHILKEITRARVQADFEAIKTAHLYVSKKDGLLKNFPIPRMRLPNIEITMPVAITDVPEGNVEKTNPDLLSQSVVSDLTELFAKKNIEMDTTEIEKIIKEDEFLSKGYFTATSIDILSAKIENLLKTTGQINTSSQDGLKQLVSLIRKQLIKTFNNLPKKPLGIAINPNTSVIKEYNKSPGQEGANVMYIKMCITEDALVMDLKEPSKTDSTHPSKIKPIIKRLSPE